MFMSRKPFDSIIQEIAQKLDEEDEELVTVPPGRTKPKVEKICAVCGDKATGCHYRCWTCEGCKGFFRRTIQKNTAYTCDFNGTCIVDKLTRTQCQKCRFDKCISVGMTPSVVNERQRTQTKRFTQEECRNYNQFANEITVPNTIMNDLIGPIVRAYRDIFIRTGPSMSVSQPTHVLDETGSVSAIHMADMLTPTISKIILFAKALSGFNCLSTGDQICLLIGSCVEILCLRAALRFDIDKQGFPLRGQRLLTRSDVLAHPQLGLLSPLFSYAQRLGELKIDETEAAIMAATWILQSSRPDLSEPERVELYQESVMSVSQRYAKTRPSSSTDELRWLKTLMTRPSPLRGISMRAQSDKLAIYLYIDHVVSLPQSFLHLFEEDH